jgi:hypothetical protein
MRDSVVEQHLEDRLVKWTYEESLSLGKFDENASLRNQARFDPLHEEAVMRYSEAMERGDRFPALVAYKNTSGKYILIDGNHRFQAAKRNKYKDFDAYVVDGSPDVIQVLTFEANARHGIPPSLEERTRHAIYLIDNGASIESAAGSTGLLVSTVNSAWGLERANRRARAVGVTRGWNRLSKEQKGRLAGISTDAGFVAATNFAIDARLSSLETRKMTNEMRALRSDRAQVAAVEELKTQYREMHSSTSSAKVHQRLDARRGLIPHIAYLSTCDLDAVLNACITPAQVEDMLSRCKDAMAAVQLLRDGLQDKQKADDMTPENGDA